MDYKLSKSEKRFLYLVYIFRCVDRKMLRLYYGDYDNNGRKISRLIDRGFLEEVKIKKKYYDAEKALSLTLKGIEYIKENTKNATPKNYA